MGMADYAVRIGDMTLPGEQVVEMFMLPTPPWYHRREEDALAMAEQRGRLARDVGDILSALAAHE
jgi:hypothetical protein